jgi:hypothetical protein
MNIHAIHALYASVVPPVPVSPHVAEILGRLQAERGPAQGDAEQNEIARLASEIAARSEELARLVA